VYLSVLRLLSAPTGLTTAVTWEFPTDLQRMWLYLSVLKLLSGPTELTAAVSDVGIPDRSAMNVGVLVCIGAPVWPDRTQPLSVTWEFPTDLQ
jgi:hypothetical protein